MQNNLTSAQCDAFVQDHNVEVRRSCYGVRDKHPWCCGDATNKAPNEIGKTRQEVITLYWREHHPNWTPPQIWDAETALEYMVKHCLLFSQLSVWNAGDIRKDVRHDGTVEGIIKAAHQWKLKHGPDKPEPTREETAMKLLGETYGHLLHPVVDASLTNKIYTFLKEADHDS